MNISISFYIPEILLRIVFSYIGTGSVVMIFIMAISFYKVKRLRKIKSIPAGTAAFFIGILIYPYLIIKIAKDKISK